VVYLDKSGRPVAWLVRALWSALAREPGTRYRDNDVPPIPTTRFANIDREQWWHLTGASETDLIDVTRVPVEAVRALRAVFLRSQPSAGHDIDTSPAWLDGRRILIVDEVSNTGDTLAIATGLISRAFPTATVRATHWMTPGRVVDRHGLARVATVPIWYRSDTWTGRLVGNRLDPANPSATWRGKAGALFLSTRPRVPDDVGLRLRREIDHLASDVRTGRLLAAPSSLRDVDDWADRVEALYGYTDLQQFTRDRLAQDGVSEIP
jgi:hemolysin-activating ACP:hemolysin acyltransferase